MDQFTSNFLGIIEPHPLTGKWHWPFVRMNIGDWFLVRLSQREPEGLRNMVMVRGSQLMKKFGFTKHDPEHPGMMKVWRKPNWEPPQIRTNFDYQGARALLDEQYGINADDILWHLCIKPGDGFNIPAKRKVKDGRTAVRVMVGDVPYIVEMMDGGLAIVRIKPGTTLDDWLQEQLDVIMRD